MLIRPQQALPLAIIYRKLYIFKYIFKMYRTLVALSNLHWEKENELYIFLTYWILYRTLYFRNYRWAKLAKLHRAKERHTPSLSNQTSVYTLSPEGGVVWNLPYSNICRISHVQLYIIQTVGENMSAHHDCKSALLLKTSIERITIVGKFRFGSVLTPTWRPPVALAVCSRHVGGDVGPHLNLPIETARPYGLGAKQSAQPSSEIRQSTADIASRLTSLVHTLLTPMVCRLQVGTVICQSTIQVLMNNYPLARSTISTIQLISGRSCTEYEDVSKSLKKSKMTLNNPCSILSWTKSQDIRARNYSPLSNSWLLSV